MAAFQLPARLQRRRAWLHETQEARQELRRTGLGPPSTPRGPQLLCWERVQSPFLRHREGGLAVRMMAAMLLIRRSRVMKLPALPVRHQRASVSGRLALASLRGRRSATKAPLPRVGSGSSGWAPAAQLERRRRPESSGRRSIASWISATSGLSRRRRGARWTSCGARGSGDGQRMSRSSRKRCECLATVRLTGAVQTSQR